MSSPGREEGRPRSSAGSNGDPGKEKKKKQKAKAKGKSKAKAKGKAKDGNINTNKDNGEVVLPPRSPVRKSNSRDSGRRSATYSREGGEASGRDYDYGTDDDCGSGDGPPDLMEVIRLLEDEKNAEIAEGRYLNAQIALNRINEIKASDEYRRLLQATLANEEEEAELEDTQREVFRHNDEDWNALVAKFEHDAAMLEDELEDRCGREVRELRQKQAAEERRPHFSKELLDLRKTEMRLVKAEEFLEANAVQVEADKRELWELEKYEHQRARRHAVEEERLLAQHERQRTALRMRVERFRRKTLKKRDVDLEHLLRQFMVSRVHVRRKGAAKRGSVERTMSTSPNGGAAGHADTSASGSRGPPPTVPQTSFSPERRVLAVQPRYRPAGEISKPFTRPVKSPYELPLARNWNRETGTANGSATRRRRDRPQTRDGSSTQRRGGGRGRAHDRPPRAPRNDDGNENDRESTGRKRGRRRRRTEESSHSTVVTAGVDGDGGGDDAPAPAAAPEAKEAEAGRPRESRGSTHEF